MKTRNVILAVLGALALVLKPVYSGPGADTVRSYGGNVSVSFALYFVVLISIEGRAHARFLAASIALGAVTAFELADGFGVMANVYDPVDLLANGVGVAIAALADVASARRPMHRSRPA